jgi:hypothetical protein
VRALLLSSAVEFFYSNGRWQTAILVYHQLLSLPAGSSLCVSQLLAPTVMVLAIAVAPGLLNIYPSPPVSQPVVR